MAEHLIENRKEKGKPMKSYYYLTSKGNEVARRMYDINKYYS